MVLNSPSQARTGTPKRKAAEDTAPNPGCKKSIAEPPAKRRLVSPRRSHSPDLANEDGDPPAEQGQATPCAPCPHCTIAALKAENKALQETADELKAEVEKLQTMKKAIAGLLRELDASS
tara:strand:- start:244 stop:603 length:360 start_codon:yes stop_codon:yes gene_type:complete